jgi:hypothetical protein
MLPKHAPIKDALEFIAGTNPSVGAGTMHREVLRLAGLVGIVWLIGSYHALCADEYPEEERARATIVGDRRLIELVRSVQRTNLAAYPRGRLRCVVSKVEQFNGRELQAQVEFVWDGDRRFATFDEQEKRPNAPERTVAGARFLELPSERLVYRPDLNQLTHNRDKSTTFPELLRLRPQERWFTYGWPQGRTWLVMLDPEFGGRFLKEYRIHQTDRDEIVVERELTVGSQLRIVCSMAHGGNIIEYRSLMGRATGNSNLVGGYEWVPDQPGSFRLSRAWQKSFRAGSSDVLETSHELKIVEFDAAAAPRPDQFTLKSLAVADGTIVDLRENGGVRRYIYGRKPASPKDHHYESLIEEVKRRGFAAPKTPLQ